MSDTREQVLQTARRLFGERGYAAVTIREIAAGAGVSPAMVMKVGGSKEQLHADATPLEPRPLAPDVPLDGLGELLVHRVLTRREDADAEPWLRRVEELDPRVRVIDRGEDKITITFHAPVGRGPPQFPRRRLSRRRSVGCHRRWRPRGARW